MRENFRLFRRAYPLYTSAYKNWSMYLDTLYSCCLKTFLKCPIKVSKKYVMVIWERNIVTPCIHAYLLFRPDLGPFSLKSGFLKFYINPILKQILEIRNLFFLKSYRKFINFNFYHMGSGKFWKPTLRKRRPYTPYRNVISRQLFWNLVIFEQCDATSINLDILN